MNFIHILLSTLFLMCGSLVTDSEGIKPKNKKQFADYWYAGEAEITSFNLKQDRYGEIHEGTAVLVFVTEPFSKSSNTKADRPTSKDVSVMKLNYTKKFNTGVYPYSLMNSTFFPVEGGEHSLKISSSSQEWCGHTYMEMTNKRNFDISIHSYFEGQSTKESIDKNLLEDDLFSMIRINPDALPVGNQQVIPSFLYMRLVHAETKAYQANMSVADVGNGMNAYTINYPGLNRELVINFESAFPHRIDSWEEKDLSSGRTTVATKMKTINSNYWSRHSNKDLALRKELGLDK